MFLEVIRREMIPNLSLHQALINPTRKTITENKQKKLSEVNWQKAQIKNILITSHEFMLMNITVVKLALHVMSLRQGIKPAN